MMIKNIIGHGGLVRQNGIIAPPRQHSGGGEDFFLIITLTIASYCSTRSRQMRLRSNQYPTIEGGLVSSTAVVMEEAVLERFPKVLYSEAKLIRNELGNNNYSTCSVCLGDYRESDEVRILLPGCGHAFHLNCIDSWLRLRPTCPLCRHQLHSLSTSPI